MLAQAEVLTLDKWAAVCFLQKKLPSVTIITTVVQLAHRSEAMWTLAAKLNQAASSKRGSDVLRKRQSRAAVSHTRSAGSLYGEEGASSRSTSA